MKIATLLAAPALLFAATTASAQPMPQPHDQREASGQHQSADAQERCCCEEKIRKMTIEMMQKRQGMGTSQSTSADQHAAAADEHQHKQ